MQITLEAVKAGGWHRYLVTFASARQALDFIAARPEGSWVEETEEHHIAAPFPIEADVAELLDVLHPQCHHGMSAALCMDPYGPNHFGTIEQEMAGIL